MMLARPRSSLVRTALTGLLVALSLVLVACGEEGVTPDCPPLPLYNVRDAGWLEDEEILEARAEAVEDDCLTELGEAHTPE